MTLKTHILFCLFIASFIQGFSQGKEYEQRIKNLATFAKLYGYVKYFYPGDEAAKIDYTKFELYAIPKVERAKNPFELKEILDSLFLPIAPCLKIYNKENPIIFDIKSLLPEGKDTAKLKLVSWQHLGAGLKGEKSVYKSLRLNRRNIISDSSNDLYANLFSSINIVPFRGKKIKLKFFIKSEGGDSKNYSYIILSKNRGYEYDTFAIEPSLSKIYEIEKHIENDYEKLNFGIHLNGKQNITIKDIKVLAQDKNYNWIQNDSLINPFPWKNSTNVAYGWYMLNKNYQALVKENNITGDIDSINLRLTESLFSKRSSFGDYIQKEIGNNLCCIMPLALYADSTNTYPKPNKSKYYLLLGSLENEISGKYDPNNKKIMLVNVIKLWNVFQHFYPYFDRIKVNWEKVLYDILQETYADNNEKDFLITINKFFSLLEDGHFLIYRLNTEGHFFLPEIKMEYVENQLVVTEILDRKSTINLGDKILAINGKDTKNYLDSIKLLVSGSTQDNKIFLAIDNYILRKDSNDLTQCLIENKNGIRRKIFLKHNNNIYSKMRNNLSANEIRWKKIEKNIYYINLNNIHRSEIDSLLPILSNAKSIIIDMRGYPWYVDKSFIGHFLKTKDTFTHFFQIPEIIYPDREKWTYYNKRYGLTVNSPHINAKVIFIIDARAISEAETFSEYFKSYELATVIGQPTAGTNGDINQIILPGNYMVIFTGMKTMKMDGSPLFGVGVLPDVYVKKTIKGVREGRDEFLEKAIEIAEKK